MTAKVMQSLAALLQGEAEISKDCQISGLTLDSRQVQTGSCFVAVPGGASDGRDYIEAAIVAGAAAVLAEKQGYAFDAKPFSVPVVLIDGLGRKLSKIAGRFYQHPSRACTVVGITGTNGKTSVAYLLAQAIDQLGKTAGLVGTIGVGVVGANNKSSLTKSTLTTPDAISVQKQLRELVDTGCEVVCMEVSSHGLQQERVAAIEFDQAVFTNLSQDHLDYHGSMQAYGEAKGRLFKYSSVQTTVVNVDDAFGQSLQTSVSLPVIACSLNAEYWHKPGCLIAQQCQPHSDGLVFEVHYDGKQQTMASPLVGEINVYNLLSVVAVLLNMDYELEKIASVLPQCKAPPGRLERISAMVNNLQSKPAVVVDFAHTPDALEQALKAVRAHCKGRLSVVFGCGGGRDKQKRPKMGRIAQSLADSVMITDDNPRGETPAAIVADILAGMQAPVNVQHKRALAIEQAVLQAEPQDWVVIAGKGHETEQVYADRTLQINDREIAADALQAWGEKAA